MALFEAQLSPLAQRLHKEMLQTELHKRSLTVICA
jgi:hypothetical protein